MNHPLDNVIWRSLVGDQARFAAGRGNARRYARGFSPIIAFQDDAAPDFEALAPFCETGEEFYCAGWSGPPPAGWRIDAETVMHRMLWDAAMPQSDAAPLAVPLAAPHAAQALALAQLTHPGPFGQRTLELGEYFGVFDGEHLIAMAGERMSALPFREISGVCTHPDCQGRGLARALTAKLVRRQM